MGRIKLFVKIPQTLSVDALTEAKPTGQWRVATYGDEAVMYVQCRYKSKRLIRGRQEYVTERKWWLFKTKRLVQGADREETGSVTKWFLEDDIVFVIHNECEEHNG